MFIFLNNSNMGKDLKIIISSAGSLFNIGGQQSSIDIKGKYLSNRRGISKHTKNIKRHFDNAYNLLNNR